MAVASPSLFPPLPPSLNGTPHCRIGCEWLHPAPSNVYESAVVRDRAMAEQSCQECQSMVGQRRIYERLLAFQRFHRTTTRQTVVVERRIDQLWEQFGDGSQPEIGRASCRERV